MAPLTLILLIPTLSLTTAVNITVWLCDEVLSSTEVSLAEKELMLGLSSSLFVTVTVKLDVEVLPAESVALTPTTLSLPLSLSPGDS